MGITTGAVETPRLSVGSDLCLASASNANNH